VNRSRAYSGLEEHGALSKKRAGPKQRTRRQATATTEANKNAINEIPKIPPYDSMSKAPPRCDLVPVKKAMMQITRKPKPVRIGMRKK
jgi:hypothetical protein